MDTAGQGRHQTATYSAMRARTVTLGEVEDALWALAEREGLHDYLRDDPEPEPCRCSLCQLIIPLLSEMARESTGEGGTNEGPR